MSRGDQADSVVNYKCTRCGCNKVEQLTRGVRVADVVGVTLDNGLVCNLVGFNPDEEMTNTYYRCKNCRNVLPFTSDEFVEFLRGEWGHGKVPM